MKTVKITIKGGQIKADFGGFAGRECERLEEKIRVQGLDVQEKEAKPELYQETSTENNTETF